MTTKWTLKDELFLCEVDRWEMKEGSFRSTNEPVIHKAMDSLTT